MVNYVYSNLKQQYLSIDRKMRLADQYKLNKISPSKNTLVYMLTGYKPDLWRFIFPMFKNALPDNVTVCLVTAGKHDEYISNLCKTHMWNYLSTKTNDVSLAQNICIHSHPEAEIIIKLDEDIFLLNDTINSILSYYQKCKTDGIVNPGFVAPVLPINGYCYRWLLKTLGLLNDFENQFGVARLATSGTPIGSSPEVARWMWEVTSPLDRTRDILQSKPLELLLCPIQFSIGCIVFEREFWEEIGLFPVYRRLLITGQNTLGADEAHLCSQAIQKSRPGVVNPHALAGHFSFGPQYEGVKSLLTERPELFTASSSVEQYAL